MSAGFTANTGPNMLGRKVSTAIVSQIANCLKRGRDGAVPGAESKRSSRQSVIHDTELPTAHCAVGQTIHLCTMLTPAPEGYLVKHAQHISKLLVISGKTFFGSHISDILRARGIPAGRIQRLRGIIDRLAPYKGVQKLPAVGQAFVDLHLKCVVVRKARRIEPCNRAQTLQRTARIQAQRGSGCWSPGNAWL